MISSHKSRAYLKENKLIQDKYYELSSRVVYLSKFFSDSISE